MKWILKTLPFLISSALATVDLNLFNQNITKPEDCPNVQYACPYCPSGQQCVYPNSGGCEGAGIPTCQAIKGCFGIVCLMRALPCPKECPFFCEYKGPPCCPFIGQPVCKPQCQTFAPCKVTQCPKECPDDCFYPNASTCCPKSGKAICKNKRHQVLTPPTEEATRENDVKETALTDNDEKKEHKLQARSYNNDRGNYHQYERGDYRGRDGRYYGRRQNQYRYDNRGYYKQRGGWSRKYPKIIEPTYRWNDNRPVIDPVPDEYPGPEAAINYFPGYKPTAPVPEDTYGKCDVNLADVVDPYANDMNDRFIPRDNNDYQPDAIIEWCDGNELDNLPPFQPIVVTVTEKITECEADDKQTMDIIEETPTTSPTVHHFCPLFIRSCPPECPHDCIYPSGVPCPYTMQPSCPPKGVNSVEEPLSSDDLLIGDLSVKDMNLQPTEPLKIGIVPLKKEPDTLPS